MRVVRRTFGPRFSEYERDVFGRANNTGHGGCWINDEACGVPDCIMADFVFSVEIERPETRLWFADFETPAESI